MILLSSSAPFALQSKLPGSVNMPAAIPFVIALLPTYLNVDPTFEPFRSFWDTVM